MEPATLSEPETEANSSNWVRNFFVGLFIFICVVSLCLLTVSRWVESQILNTDNWVSMVTPLPKDPAVSSALGNYISRQIFDAQAVEQKISSSLPPGASFLAGPLTSELNSFTNKAAQKLVASDAFQSIWSAANRAAMNRLIAVGRGQPTPLAQKLQGKFNLNISGTSGELSKALGGAAQAIPALQPAAHKLILVSADLKTRQQRIRQTIKTIDFIAAVLPFLTITAFLAALNFSKHRRRTTLSVVIAAVVALLVELIALGAARNAVLGQVKNPGNLAAVGVIFDTLNVGLRQIIYTTLVIAIVLGVLLIVAGPGKWFRILRMYIRLDRLRDTNIWGWIRASRQWTRHWEKYFWIGTLITVLAIVFIIGSFTGKVIINAALITLGLIMLIHIFATPPWQTMTPRPLDGVTAVTAGSRRKTYSH